MAYVVDEQGYEFLWELVWTVVVGAVRHYRRHPVGVVERAHEVVAGCLARAVRAVGLVFRVLGEELVPERASPALPAPRAPLRAVHLQRPVHLVGGDVVEAFTLIFLRKALPPEARRLKKAKRPEHVGPGECERVLDAPVHVAFSREVDHPVHLLLLHKGMHRVEVAHVRLDEAVVRRVLDVAKVFKVAGIGKFVHVDDPVFRIFRHEQTDDVAPDEARAAGDDD